MPLGSDLVRERNARSAADRPAARRSGVPQPLDAARGRALCFV